MYHVAAEEKDILVSEMLNKQISKHNSEFKKNWAGQWWPMSLIPED